MQQVYISISYILCFSQMNSNLPQKFPLMLYLFILFR